MANTEVPTNNGIIDFDRAIKNVLKAIDKEREREIISRRFGLFERKETLEQIGELLGITRERVRQLEKVVVTKLKNAAKNGELNEVGHYETQLISIISQNNNCMRISDIASLITEKGDRIDQARIFFLAELAPKISIVDENDYFYRAVGIKSKLDSKKLKELAGLIVETIKKIGQPTDAQEIANQAKLDSEGQVAAIAKISKQLAELNGKWGLTKWPMVNPKNIRDKIYVILSQKKEHMHFNDISDAIKASDFKRKDVTTQAIHNELIKDKRFVLIGRGIYALEEWGYKRGTVADTIGEVLRDANKPLHRDEIVKRVLKSRHVKETTILLNLQGKQQFKRVAKATYALADKY